MHTEEPTPGPQLGIGSFIDNSKNFCAVERMRNCLLWLSREGAVVLRMQAKEGRVLVEVDRALDVMGVHRESHGGEDYGSVDVGGCKVIWRKASNDTGCQ